VKYAGLCVLFDTPKTNQQICQLAAAGPQTVRFFINETRRSLSHFRDVVDEDVWLIYNDPIVFSGRHIHVDVSLDAALGDAALRSLGCVRTRGLCAELRSSCMCTGHTCGLRNMAQGLTLLGWGDAATGWEAHESASCA
jgi:hypothetical protein